MGMYDGFLPKEQKAGHHGYYPVVDAQEWDNLPAVYKAMEWRSVEMTRNGYKETTVAEYVEFDVVYMEPYKVRATVRVHVQEVQKILFCLFRNAQCHLYSICGVVFQNGERWPAEWKQDATTGAYAVIACGHYIGMQGGYLGFVPSNIKRTDDGGFEHVWNYSGPRCHYDISNPFR